MNNQGRRKTTAFGRQVKMALDAKMLTQHDLALILGVKDSYLCDILKGSRAPGKYENKIKSILEITDIETSEQQAS